MEWILYTGGLMENRIIILGLSVNFKHFMHLMIISEP